MARNTAAIALNFAIAAVVLIAWGSMALRFDESGALSAHGLRSLRYFTVLSNLLEAVACAVWAVCMLRGGVPTWATALKYAATVSVALTLSTVVAFLGPTMGWADMFSGANLWFHLVVPVAALIGFCALERERAVPLGWIPLAALPMLAYGTGYVANLVAHGTGDGHDWYGFARHGLHGAAVSFVVMLFATLLLAALIRLPRRG